MKRTLKFFSLLIAISVMLTATACSEISEIMKNGSDDPSSILQKTIWENETSSSSMSSTSTVSDVDNISSTQKPSQSTSTVQKQDLATAQAKFQEVFEQVQPKELYENQYAGCKRYTLVNDYDGDGTLEAFAFFGIESNWQPAPFWENICLYYIDSDYTVTSLAGDSSGYDSLIGSINCPEPNYKDDFSNCFFESGNERYLAWSVTYWEGDWFALVLGVHDGKPVLSYPGSVFYVNDAGQFVTLDENDNEVILQLKDGKATPAS